MEQREQRREGENEREKEGGEVIRDGCVMCGV